MLRNITNGNIQKHDINFFNVWLSLMQSVVQIELIIQGKSIEFVLIRTFPIVEQITQYPKAIFGLWLVLPTHTGPQSLFPQDFVPADHADLVATV